MRPENLLEDPPDMGGLAKAVVAVMKDVSSVPETGHNKNASYSYHYASDTDLLRALQPAMAKHGLCLLPERVDATTVEHGKSAAGTAQWRTDVKVTYLLVHTSGAYVRIQVAGSGVDPADKGLYKALTGALKYALRHTFLVPTGDDAERDGPESDQPTFKDPVLAAIDACKALEDKVRKLGVVQFTQAMKDAQMPQNPKGGFAWRWGSLPEAKVEEYHKALKKALLEVPNEPGSAG
jgi:hypothetical protein